MRCLHVCLAIVALSLVGASSDGAIRNAGKPVAPAVWRDQLCTATVWITFLDGSSWPAVITWWGNPESIDYDTATIFVVDANGQRAVSRTWLIGATITARPTFQQ